MNFEIYLTKLFFDILCIVNKALKYERILAGKRSTFVDETILGKSQTNEQIQNQEQNTKKLIFRLQI